MDRQELDSEITLIWSDFLAGQQSHLGVHGKYKQFLRGEVLDSDGVAMPDVACHEMQRGDGYRAFLFVAVANEDGVLFVKQWLHENGGETTVTDWQVVDA